MLLNHKNLCSFLKINIIVELNNKDQIIGKYMVTRYENDKVIFISVSLKKNVYFALQALL